jgi:hypothetical protein
MKTIQLAAISILLLFFTVVTVMLFQADHIPTPEPIVAPATSVDYKPEATGMFEAYQWRRLAWVDENGYIPPGGLSNAIQQRNAYLQSFLDPSGFGDPPTTKLNWISRGPDNVGGRTRTLVIHPDYSNIIWAGSVGGGVWKSLDGGSTWAAMNGAMQKLHRYFDGYGSEWLP